MHAAYVVLPALLAGCAAARPVEERAGPDADVIRELVERALPHVGWPQPHRDTVALRVYGWSGPLPARVAGMEVVTEPEAPGDDVIVVGIETDGTSASVGLVGSWGGSVWVSFRLRPEGDRWAVEGPTFHTTLG